MPRSYSAVHVHLVFATKNRRAFLTDPGQRGEMHAYLAGVSRTLDCAPVIIGGVEDHVHILAKLGKSISQAEWIKELKRVSSKWAKDLDPKLAAFGWQGGYGMHSVGADGLAVVRRYIEGQEEHHRTVTFEEEFMQLLTEHGMEWDPRDSWD